MFVPLFALAGIKERLFAPLGVAYIVSIMASLIVSIAVTPVLCYFLLARMKRMDHGDAWLVRKLEAGNERALLWAFRRSGLVYVVAGVAVAIATLPFLPRAFLPPFNEGTLTISLQCQPGSVNVGQPIGHRLDHMLSGVRAEIALKIYGDDLDTLRALAAQMQQRLGAVPGPADLQIERQVRIPQLHVTVNHERAKAYGVSVASRS